MAVLSIDIETYSSYDLKQTGVYKYTEADDFEVLMIAWALDDEPVRMIDMKDEDAEGHGEFTGLLFDPSVTKRAFNANFERTCLSAHYKRPMPPEEWKDTMIDAARAGLPRSLEKCAEVLKLSEQKDKAGKALITFFSKPCKATKTNGGRTRNLPEHDTEKWNDFKDYCIQDVYTERAIAQKLKAFTYPDFEHRMWTIDQHINDRGVKVDESLMQGAVELDEIAKRQLMEKARELTGLDNPNSPQQLLKWLQEHGTELADLKAETVKNAVKTSQGVVQEVLMIRQELSKTSVKKYTKMRDMACRDGRIRGVFQFYGANTGRWAGRGVQLQNLTKHYMSDGELDLARHIISERQYDAISYTLKDSPTSLLSQIVRTCFIADEGQTLAVSDFSAIEARVIAWYAEEKWRLNLFSSEGGDIYIASASQMFGIPADQIDKTTNEGAALRQKGKVSELACGYSGGVGALKAMGAIKMGVKEEELQGLIDAWRSSNPNIVNFWYSVQRAAIDTVKTGRTNYTNRLKIYMKGNFLIIELPSGRTLSYPAPHITLNRFGSETIAFKTVGMNGQWITNTTYGGKLVENIVQATARDILAESMIKLEDKGYPVVMHIHDEVVIETQAGQLKAIEDIMAEPLKWAPGLPLSSAGFESPFYMKD